MRFKRHFSIWTIIKAIDQISKWTGLTFAWLAVPLAVILIWEVFARKLFSPTFWAFDLSYMLYGGHFMLVAAYTLYRGGAYSDRFLLSAVVSSLARACRRNPIFFPFSTRDEYFLMVKLGVRL